MYKYLPLFVLLCIGISCFAQINDGKNNVTNSESPFSVTSESSFTGIISNKENVPFWMHTNTNDAIAERTNLSVSEDLKLRYSFGNSFLEAGAAYFIRDGVQNSFQRRDLYLSYQNTWLKATLGAKASDIEFDGLSSTNKNFLLSTNARPLPGIVIEAAKPIKISSTFGIDWGIGQYYLNEEDRYVQNVKVHYKRLGLITKFNENNILTTRIQHYAQWGGTSPEFGKLASSFAAFVDVFFAKKTNETNIEGERVNALGNHLGSYFLEYEYKTQIGEFSFYHEHPFEDGSGTRLANFPDGVWGISFREKKPTWFSAILYEFSTTVDQSGKPSRSGGDNYFRNGLYRNGWTYDGNVIGFPFILIDTSIKINENTTQIIGSRVQVHHLGLAGKIKDIDWKIKTTYSKNLGTYGGKFIPPLKNWYNYVSLKYKTEKIGAITIMGGMDISNFESKLLAGGLTYSYNF